MQPENTKGEETRQSDNKEVGETAVKKEGCPETPQGVEGIFSHGGKYQVETYSVRFFVNDPKIDDRRCIARLQE